ncbi:MAG: preQ(1) synthase [Chloroflexota bacterium]
MTTDKYSSKRFDIQQEDAIDVGVLEAIPFDYAPSTALRTSQGKPSFYPGSATEVVYETDEFTAVCPWTGLPDFANLVITYVPDNSLVELKSLKYYLTSYRNVGILQEHAVNHILQDLVHLLQPVSMTIEAEYNERGGIKTKATARWERE